MYKEIIDKIKKAQAWGATRYQIDNDLIGAGHDPASIDAAWQQLNQKRKLPKRHLPSKLMKSPVLWFTIINLGLLLWFCSAHELIPYYWLRYSKSFAFPIALSSIIGGVIFLTSFKYVISKQTKAAILWLWGTIFFFSICSVMLNGAAWSKTAELVTPAGTYHLIEKQTRGFAMVSEYYEVHRCNFVVWCERMERKNYIDGVGGVNPRTKEEKLEVLTERYKIDSGEKK
jgi:hypothetical protein